jgi:hypothetical protein
MMLGAPMPMRGRKMSPAGDPGSTDPTITGRNINHVRAKVATRNTTTIRRAVTPARGRSLSALIGSAPSLRPGCVR